MEQKETPQEITAKILVDWDNDSGIEFGSLPSLLQVRQVCKVQFTQDQAPITGTITGVHFFKDKVKYDVDLWVMWHGEEGHTRIYNVDSAFIKAS